LIQKIKKSFFLSIILKFLIWFETFSLFSLKDGCSRLN